MTITASRALYIKLGEGNAWADLAFSTQSLRFGFADIPHPEALLAVTANDFSSVKRYYEDVRSTVPGTATRYSNEVREFYTASSDVLWITFVGGRLWWCFANTEVFPTPSADEDSTGSRYRNVVGSWSDKDASGQTLWINSLRGSLTTTAGFRGTICRVTEFEYLLRRLNAEETEPTGVARAARLRLIEAIVPLISGLHWKDFELLAELVMTQGGWRRVSATGGPQQTIDLELELPLTGERALVQVKSRLDRETAARIAADLAEAAGGSRIFIVYHTPVEPLSIDRENVTIIGPHAVAEHVVDLGLVSWIMKKVG